MPYSNFMLVDNKVSHSEEITSVDTLYRQYTHIVGKYEIYI